MDRGTCTRRNLLPPASGLWISNGPSTSPPWTGTLFWRVAAVPLAVSARARRRLHHPLPRAQTTGQGYPLGAERCP
jgi:carbonic anhydrase